VAPVGVTGKRPWRWSAIVHTLRGGLDAAQDGGSQAAVQSSGCGPILCAPHEVQRNL
jgi:hypothetical protein